MSDDDKKVKQRDMIMGHNNRQQQNKHELAYKLHHQFSQVLLLFSLFQRNKTVCKHK